MKGGYNRTVTYYKINDKDKRIENAYSFHFLLPLWEPSSKILPLHIFFHHWLVAVILNPMNSLSGIMSELPSYRSTYNTSFHQN